MDIKSFVTAILEAVQSLKNPHGPIEFEFRYGEFDEKGSFRSGVSAVAFRRLQAYLQSLQPDVRSQYISSTLKSVAPGTSSPGGIRSGFRRRDVNGRIEYIEKRILNSRNVAAYGQQWILSEERSVTEKEYKADPGTESRSDKVRWSYVMDGWRIDLSRVTLGTTTTYQVEIELLKADEIMADLLTSPDKQDAFGMTAIRYATKYLQIMQGSPYIYTASDKKSLLARVNPNPLILVNPRNLHMEDMLWGGLAGGKYQYSISYKPDGIRKLLFIQKYVEAESGTTEIKGGLWMFNPLADDYTLLYPGKPTKPANSDPVLWDTKVSQLRNWLKENDGICIEAEFCEFDRSGRRFNIPVFVLWDVIMLNGRTDIQQKSHSERRRNLRRFINQGPPDMTVDQMAMSPPADVVAASHPSNAPFLIKEICTFIGKDFLLFSDRMELAANVMHLESRLGDFPVPVDPGGAYVFIPENTPYLTMAGSMPVQKLSLQQRVLSAYPETVKWKGLITVDLLYRPTEGLLAGGENKEFKRFIATNEIDMDTKFPDGPMVVEVTRNDKGNWIMIRPRPDKPAPNDWVYAEDAKHLLDNPIKLSTLKAQDLSLLFQYVNFIKRRLISEEVGKKGIILDCGSGRGGDIGKFEHEQLARAYLVEPFPPHVDELRKRVAKMRKTEGKIISKSFLDITEADVPELVDAISIFLSAGFFWGSEASLRQLAAIIRKFLRPGGSVLVVTLDGDALIHQVTTDEKGSLSHGVTDLFLYGDPEKRIELGSITGVDIGKRTLKISLKGSKTLIDGPASTASPASPTPFSSDVKDVLPSSQFSDGKQSWSNTQSPPSNLGQEESMVFISDLAAAADLDISSWDWPADGFLSTAEKQLARLYGSGVLRDKRRAPEATLPELPLMRLAPLRHRLDRLWNTLA